MNAADTEQFLLSIAHFGNNTFARAMRTRAQIYFMFTDSTTKHFYGSVASMGIYYCTHNTRLFHIFFSFHFFYFLLFFLSVFARLFYPAKLRVLFYFPSAAFNSLLLKYSSLSYYRITAFRLQCLCILFCDLRLMSTLRAIVTTYQLTDASATVCV